MSEEQIEHVPLIEIEMRQLLRKEVFPEKLAGITQSIERDGMLYPVRLIRLNGKYVPIDGLHRCLAALKLEWKTIPALIETRELSEPELLALGLSANSHRSDNTPLEKAEAIARIMRGTGWTLSQVAEHLTYSPANVTKLLTCLKLPESIRLQLHRGEIGLGTAYELSKISDPEEQMRLAAQVAASELTRDSLLRHLKVRTPADPSVPKPPALKRAVAMLGEGRSISVTAAELDLDRFLELLEQLVAKTRKVRPRGIELPTFLKMLRDEAKAEEV